MQFGINLVPTQEPVLKEEKFWRRIKLVGGIVLSVYIVFIAALLVFSLLISASEKKLKQEVSGVESQIKGLAKKENLQVSLKGRLETASKILGTRAEQKELLSQVQGFILPGISLNEINLVAEKVDFSGEAQDAKVLADFLDQFEGQKNDWPVIKLTSLARTQKGIYSFSLDLNSVISNEKK